MEKLYSLKEAKQLLGVKTRTIQQWDKTGKLYGMRSHKQKEVIANVKNLLT